MTVSTMRLPILILFASIFINGCGVARYEQTGPASPEGSSGNPAQPKPGDPPAARVSEVFEQDRGGNRVDILVISDDSFSMNRDQKKLGAKFNRFIAALGDIDWQVGITTTDVSASGSALRGSLAEVAPGIQFLTPSTTDAQKKFEATVVRPCNLSKCGSSNEQALAASFLAMQKSNSENRGFFRDNVDLAIVVISDEDEMSAGKDRRATQPQTVINQFKSLWGETKSLGVYGIVIRPGEKACLQAQREEDGEKSTAHYGTFVSELARLSQGSTHSICASDYGPLVSQIGEKIKKLVQSFELSQVPAPGSVEVRLTPTAKIDYRVEGKRVVFADAPQPGTQIEISYTPVASSAVN